MFRFKPTTQTYSDPVSATFKPGIPFGREYSKGDMCLLHDGFQSSKIFMNSTVLREAILNSKEYLEEALGLKITDANDVPKVKGKPEPREASDEDILGGDITDNTVIKKTKPSKKDTIIEDSIITTTATEGDEPIVVDLGDKPIEEPVAVYKTTKKK